MKEINILIPVFVVGYIVFMSISIILVRLFFPFLTKEEQLKKRKAFNSLNHQTNR